MMIWVFILTIYYGAAPNIPQESSKNSEELIIDRIFVGFDGASAEALAVKIASFGLLGCLADFLMHQPLPLLPALPVLPDLLDFPALADLLLVRLRPLLLPVRLLVVVDDVELLVVEPALSPLLFNDEGSSLPSTPTGTAL